MARNPGLNTSYSEGVQAELDALGRSSRNVWYVDSGAGNASNSNSGSSWEKPKATIDGAINAAAAGDVIRVASRHAESIAAAAGIDADVAGIWIVGEGHGERRPVITFTTATTADLDVDAANIRFTNLVFKNDIDSQTAMIDVNSTGAIFEDCDFLEGSSKQALIFMDLDGGANGCDRTVVRRCYFKSIAAGAASAIKLTEVQDRVLIEDCIIDGDFDDAGIHNPTGKTCTNLIIRRNIVRNRQTGDHAIELVSACTGECTDNRLFGDTSGTVLDPGSLFCAGNLESAAIDEPGVSTPVALVDSANNAIGVDDSNNAFASTNVAANEDGSVLERLEQIQEAVNIGTGTSLGANKSLVDALGTNGVTLVDDAASVVGILGVDDSNNAFASTNVTANADGSILERLENLHQVQTGAAASITTHPLLGIKVSRSTADVIGNSTIDLFTISGGRILLTCFIGEVTTIIGAGATNMKFQANPTTGTTTDLSANLDIDADEVGTLYSLHGTATQATVRGESGSVPVMAGASRGIICAAGTIAVVTDADRTGSIKFDLWYWPLDTGASVAAA